MNIKKIALPIVLLIVCLAVAMTILKNPPESKRGKPKQVPQLAVAVDTLTYQGFTIGIDSYGTVKPRTQSVLLPQVSGQVTYISENFRDGGFFQQGEILVKLDQRDYLAEIQIAQANLYSAEQNLTEERARVEQAKQDWQRLGNNEQAPDLVLRKPQLLATQAQVSSAQASLVKAELALERTQIIAPYTGRILQKHVDLGQVVSSNNQLADIYAVDYVEIRLPIKNKDLPYIQLPERTHSTVKTNYPNVAFSSDIMTKQYWQGKVVRTEGAFDTASQQLFVVAQINDPYGVTGHDQTLLDQAQNKMPIKIGQYLTANIEGKSIDKAIIIPNKTIYQGSYVYLVNNGQLQRQDIEISWQNEKVAMIKKGLSVGQLLVTTPLGQVNSGTPVEINSRDGKPLATKKKGRSKTNNKKSGATS